MIIDEKRYLQLLQVSLIVEYSNPKTCQTIIIKQSVQKKKKRYS